MLTFPFPIPITITILRRNTGMIFRMHHDYHFPSHQGISMEFTNEYRTLYHPSLHGRAESFGCGKLDYTADANPGSCMKASQTRWPTDCRGGSCEVGDIEVAGGGRRWGLEAALFPPKHVSGSIKNFSEGVGEVCPSFSRFRSTSSQLMENGKMRYGKMELKISAIQPFSHFVGPGLQPDPFVACADPAGRMRRSMWESRCPPMQIVHQTGIDFFLLLYLPTYSSAKLNPSSGPLSSRLSRVALVHPLNIRTIDNLSCMYAVLTWLCSRGGWGEEEGGP